MQAHIIENGVVVNTIIVPDLSWPVAEGQTLIDGSAGSIGWAYVDGVLIEPEKPVVVPANVTMRQARLALHANGVLSQVDAAIASLPEPYRTEAHIEWDYSSTAERSKPFVAMIGQALGLDDEAIDQLFIQAATL